MYLDVLKLQITQNVYVHRKHNQKHKENTKAAVKKAMMERFYQIVINLSYLLNANKHYVMLTTSTLQYLLTRVENLHILIHIKQ